MLRNLYQTDLKFDRIGSNLWQLLKNAEIKFLLVTNIGNLASDSNWHSQADLQMLQKVWNLRTLRYNL